MSDLNFYAQPYSLDPKAEGFYFNDLDTYREKVAKMKDSFGYPIEEFEHILIDAPTSLDAELWQALGGDGRGSIWLYLDLLDIASDHEIKQIIAKHWSTGHDFHRKAEEYIKASEDIIIHYISDGFGDPYKRLAEQFVDDGLYGDIPEHLASYIDYEAIGRDLRCSGFYQMEIDGETVIIDSQSV